MRIIDEALLQEFRYVWQCEFCNRSTPGCDPHHIFSRGAGRLDIRENIVSLCRKCHQLNHDGKITRAELLDIVARREHTTAAKIVAKVYRLRRKRK